jgi:hypothetical protein
MSAIRDTHRRPVVFHLLSLFLIMAFCTGTSFSQSSSQAVHAYYFRKLPLDYNIKEKLIASLKDTGANTIILELPMTEQGLPDLGKIPDSVYLAHQAGLKLFIVLPTRKFHGILSQHKDWEDARYDLRSGTVQSTGKFDLFNPAVVAYLASLSKEIASYSVDALLLGPDFYYAPVEGIGPAARKQTMIDLKWAPDPRMLFKKVTSGSDGLIIEQYGDTYGKWTEQKRDRLLQVFDQIRKAGRSVNAELKIGIPIPIVMPITTEDKIFTEYAYDIGAFRKFNSDYYWTTIGYQDIKSKQNLTYRQTMEQISRIANFVVTSVKLPNQVILALQATTENGRMMTLYEIEEITELLRNSGETGIAFIIGEDDAINRLFMKKIFRNKVQ